MVERMWPGIEHALFVRAVGDALRRGLDEFGKETERREAWVAEHGHRFPEAVLVAYVGYAEEILGSGWVDRMRHAHMQEELGALRDVRHALVHTGGDLTKLRDPKASRRVRTYAASPRGSGLVHILTHGEVVRLIPSAETFERLRRLWLYVVAHADGWGGPSPEETLEKLDLKP